MSTGVIIRSMVFCTSSFMMRSILLGFAYRTTSELGLLYLYGLWSLVLHSGLCYWICCRKISLCWWKNWNSPPIRKWFRLCDPLGAHHSRTRGISIWNSKLWTFFPLDFWIFCDWPPSDTDFIRLHSLHSFWTQGVHLGVQGRFVIFCFPWLWREWASWHFGGLCSSLIFQYWI